MNIRRSVALVTGANRGLGLSLTRALLARGAKMVRGLDVPKMPAEEVARLALDGVEAGADEVLVDQLTRTVKDGLSRGLYLRAPSAPRG
ncbi:hypothetical protein D187_010469 [Cystobacter fuscus DSM 2262]|uniref:Uncharacterized protein n=1 Tax=Cystobacter fuscus (strain ATCC 25194 / DSM 2262 / NBRC 100088 / M29) TaxID=1242864 RepID=S9PBR0_CYSF2|nr:hypothetical protein [Cystobacter fuscus]EPX61850.1 hypothetical protein D187_010469 [Cystobacter fuscus DSM 2262]